MGPRNGKACYVVQNTRCVLVPVGNFPADGLIYEFLSKLLIFNKLLKGAAYLLRAGNVDGYTTSSLRYFSHRAEISAYTGLAIPETFQNRQAKAFLFRGEHCECTFGVQLRKSMFRDMPMVLNNSVLHSRVDLRGA
ncbi:hypothetical protein D3C87_1534940 [compost metagenome]